MNAFYRAKRPLAIVAACAAFAVISACGASHKNERDRTAASDPLLVPRAAATGELAGTARQATALRDDLLRQGYDLDTSQDEPGPATANGPTDSRRASHPNGTGPGLAAPPANRSGP